MFRTACRKVLIGTMCSMFSDVVSVVGGDGGRILCWMADASLQDHCCASASPCMLFAHGPGQHFLHFALLGV